MKTLLKNCQIVEHGNELRAVDILIKNDKINAITESNTENSDKDENEAADQIINTAGKLVLPGLVDVHVHLREPGYEYKETIRTGTLAAARGGFTTVCAMPNLAPTPDTVKNLKIEQKLIAENALVKVLPYATITAQRTSESAVSLAELAAAGAFAFSNDGAGVQTATAMYTAMEAAAKAGKAIVAHAEDASLMRGGVIRESAKADELGLPGWSPLVESTQIARDLVLAEATGVHYHVCHLSTKASVQLIREAKKRGVHVTAEAAPHHLILAVEDIPADDAMYKMNPPLPTREDQQALIEGLLDGTIDMIATDHAPHSADEKNAGFIEGAFGIVGSETAFALMYTEFVEKGIFTLEELVSWMSLKPAEVFGIQTAGGLKVGDSADLTVIDIEQNYKIIAEDFESQGKNTPFIGWKVKGMTEFTMVDGQIVWKKVKG